MDTSVAVATARSQRRAAAEHRRSSTSTASAAKADSGERATTAGATWSGKGKRGGLRVIYYYWTGGPQLWLFTLYDKDEMADLSPRQRVELKERVRGTRDEQEMSKKRDLYDELLEGSVALDDQRAGKRTE